MEGQRRTGALSGPIDGGKLTRTRVNLSGTYLTCACASSIWWVTRSIWILRDNLKHDQNDAISAAGGLSFTGYNYIVKLMWWGSPIAWVQKWIMTNERPTDG